MTNEEFRRRSEELATNIHRTATAQLRPDRIFEMMKALVTGLGVTVSPEMAARVYAEAVVLVDAFEKGQEAKR